MRTRSCGVICEDDASIQGNPTAAATADVLPHPLTRRYSHRAAQVAGNANQEPHLRSDIELQEAHAPATSSDSKRPKCASPRNRVKIESSDTAIGLMRTKVYMHGECTQGARRSTRAAATIKAGDDSAVGLAKCEDYTQGEGVDLGIHDEASKDVHRSIRAAAAIKAGSHSAVCLARSDACTQGEGAKFGRHDEDAKTRLRSTCAAASPAGGDSAMGFARESCRQGEGSREVSTDRGGVTSQAAHLRTFDSNSERPKRKIQPSARAAAAIEAGGYAAVGLVRGDNCERMDRKCREADGKRRLDMECKSTSCSPDSAEHTGTSWSLGTTVGALADQHDILGIAEAVWEALHPTL